MSTIEMRIEILWSVSNWFGQKVDTLQSAEHHAQKPFRTERAKLRQNCINCLCDKNVHKLLLLTYHVYHGTHGRELLTLSGKFPDCPETFKTGWKLSKLARIFPDCQESFQTGWKLSTLSRNFPDSLETFRAVCCMLSKQSELVMHIVCFFQHVY